MTFLEIIKSQNGQIYPEEPFSHGAAQLFSDICLLVIIIINRDWDTFRFGILPTTM